ncbi:tetratricopeptide repeat protein [Candidatus Sodalis endolongispinus]|uniref:Ancillary SecYEG translocon subunit n=1 Tax=Candidatus Sodalis endolongispinus TaxID=2812662 RepID=A0ABS5YAB1_9GAMM|nr:tetratricopeptide repeat protein [Candidatus Sodalis endolongispinus]MBT9431871.1 tetratricopeptide repeat protein [Candidatus Sodalis endolongispinus]
MEVYSTDNKQRDARRRFFVDNGKALAIGVVLGVGALVGWRYWHNHHNDAMMAASSAWQPVNAGLSGQAAQTQLDAAQHFADANDNNYGALTSMGLARQFAERGDFTAAEKQLQKALGQTREANLQSLINLRLARVQLQQKNVDGALKTLDGVKEQGWTALAEDTRGDAQVIKGDQQAARAAYEKALQSGAPQALQALVRMKLNNLSS